MDTSTPQFLNNDNKMIRNHLPSSTRALDIVWHNFASATLAMTSCKWRTSCSAPNYIFFSDTKQYLITENSYNNRKKGSTQDNKMIHCINQSSNH